MKPMDLLRYMDMADHKYVDEASDRGVRAYRARKNLARFAVAASLAFVVLAGAVVTRPALYLWETRNTVASWSDSYMQIPGLSAKPSSPILVSAELPIQKRMAAATPFTLSVGLGQSSSYDYATLSVKAYGFEITDKDGNTAKDRYVRTLSDFNSGDYGMLYEDSFGRSRLTGCEYLEEFTFRFVGAENFTGWGLIEFSLRARDGSSSAGQHVTVYYTVENGTLKLSRKNPVKGNENGGGNHAVLVPEDEEMIPTEENITVRAEMSTQILHPREFCLIEMTARVQPRGDVYPTENFTAVLRYAETVGGRDYSFLVRDTEKGGFVAGGTGQLFYAVPDDAPAGAYDLVITDQETGFEWVFENMAWVLPWDDPSLGSDTPAYEDFTCIATAVKPILLQGEDYRGAIDYQLMYEVEDVSYFCKVELVYAEDGGDGFSFTVKDSPLSSTVSAPYVPTDAPVGGYDLIVTDVRYGYTWRFNHFVEIAADPEAQRFVFHTDIEGIRTVSRTSKTVYRFDAIVENRGATFTVPDVSSFCPSVGLTLTGGDGTAVILCQAVWPNLTESPTELMVKTGYQGACRYELILTPDTPCGLYDLTFSYGGVSVTIPQAVEVVE